VVRPNPVLFKLPKCATLESKENQSPDAKNFQAASGLPYRSVFAVLTLDSVLVYDTYHSRPLSIVRGLHYAGLTDCTWSKDGLNLLVSSTDGYISVLSFSPGELGDVYTPPPPSSVAAATATTANSVKTLIAPTEVAPIPPCDPGQTATLQAPPTKRAKTRIVPTLISSPTLLPLGTSTSSSSKVNNAPPKAMDNSASSLAVVGTAKRSIEMETDTVGAAVTKLSLGGDADDAAGAEKPQKKKKRVQPMLISTSLYG
jgi:hypothetical protein